MDDLNLENGAQSERIELEEGDGAHSERIELEDGDSTQSERIQLEEGDGAQTERIELEDRDSARSKRIKLEHGEGAQNKSIKQDVGDGALSKNQQKKLARKQKWLEMKPLRKAKDKEKHRRRVQEAKLSGKNSLGPSRKMLKIKKMADSPCKIRVVFDLSFDSVMTEFELSKTFKQLNRCYSFNRRAPAPLQIHITGYSDASQSTMSELGILNWDANVNKDPFEKALDKDCIIYLSSESSNTLEQLDEDKAYVIGALVDHNRLKGVCHKKAMELGVNHAKLPLDEYIKMDGRKVLTVDQVYLILLKVSEGKSWEEAFIEVIPKRKCAVVKDGSKSNLKLECNTDCTSGNDSAPRESFLTKTESNIVQEIK